MHIPTAVMRTNLHILSPFLKNGTLEAARALQDACGSLMTRIHKGEAEASIPLHLGAMEMGWAAPSLPTGKKGVLLYLHGGGYTTGDLAYALGFGCVLAAETGRRVLCPAYRLAPEHPFPAALEDAMAAYEYLLETGVAPEEIVLCGESAGGGLLLSLCHALRERGGPLPAGLIPISPWTDLALTGPSCRENREKDPCLSNILLDFYARAYTGERPEIVRNPLVSPLYGDFSGFPPCLMFASSEELIVSDATRLQEKLLAAGVRAALHIAPGLWHAYVLYGVKESEKALEEISAFLDEVLP